MTPLERRFGRLLLLYPKAYRDERGAEILATVLESADPGRRWPSPAEVADLGVHALRRRAGLCGEQAFGRLLAEAAPTALYMAAVLSVVAFVFGEWAPWLPAQVRHFSGPGPFATVGPAIYASWVGAALAWALGKTRLARGIAAFGVALIGASLPASHLLPYGRPPLSLLATLACLGGFSVLAPQPSCGRFEVRTGSARVSRLGLGLAGTAALVLCVVHVAGLDYDSRMAFYRLGLGTIADWMPVCAALALVGALAARALCRPAISAMVAMLMCPWLVLAVAAQPGPRPGDRALCAFLAGALALVALWSAHAERIPVTSD